MTKVIRKLLPLAAGVLATIGAVPAHAWEPTKPVEIVVPAGPGGAADQMVRALQGIITKHHLMKQPIVVLNMAGASGGEGLMDTKASKGNPHKLVMAFSAIYTVPASAKLPFNWRDLNPVALVALDEFLLWDNAEAPQKTTAEFLAAAKAAGPGVFKMGGTGSKREDQIITVAIEKAAGVKFSYIPYTSGGQAATQLVGKHTESNVNNPSENVAQWRAGQVRALCVLSPTRIVYKQKITKDQAWSDIPTCKETGLDVSYQMLRAFFLPGGTTPDQVAYYVDVLKQATATPEWKEYIANQALKESFVTGPDFVKFLEQDEAFNNKLMTEAGFVAK
jgi:putative tricarboxylic transport membrane protein